jgi:membrane protease YdiL (CAAX protease family)
MKNGDWSQLGGFSKLLVLLLIVLISAVVLSVVSLLMALPFLESFSVLNAGDNNLSIGAIKYFQIAQSFSVFIIPGLLAGYFFWGHPTRGLGLTGPKASLIVLSSLIILACQPLAGYLGLFNSQMELPGFLEGLEAWMQQTEESANNLIFQFLDTGHPGQIAINILMITILPALGEEMLFRGSLQPIATQWLKNKHAAVWFTAFLFSAIHLQFFTFLPRFFLGLLLGYLMVWGKNLWYSVAGHFTNNLMALVVFYYYRHAHPDINPLEPSPDELSLWWLIPGTLALVALLWAFYQKKENRSERPNIINLN